MLLTKENFRQICLQQARLVARRHYSLDHIIRGRLSKMIARLKPRSLLVYIPLGSEVDLMPLVKIWRKNMKIYTPFMREVSFDMVEYRLPLKRKKFGIRESSGRVYRYTKIDVAIVPIVGMDSQYKRIGFGKGMYDRFFGRLSYHPTTIFIQRSACMTSLELTDFYDIQADYVITSELTLVNESRNYDLRNFGIRSDKRCGRFRHRKTT